MLGLPLLTTARYGKNALSVCRAPLMSRIDDRDADGAVAEGGPRAHRRVSAGSAARGGWHGTVLPRPLSRRPPGRGQTDPPRVRERSAVPPALRAGGGGRPPGGRVPHCTGR